MNLSCILLAIVVVVPIVVFFSHVVHRHLIAAAESIAIVVAQAPLHVRMAVTIMIVRIPLAMSFEVAPCGFNSVMEAAPLRLAELIRSLVPWAVLIISGGRFGRAC